MDDFKRIIHKDVVIEIVNLTRATLQEAGELKKILTEDIENGFRKVVVDISRCGFIDSTFLGALVYSLKNIAEVGGDIRIVKLDFLAGPFIKKLGTMNIFNVFKSVEEAIGSYDFPEVQNHYIGKSCIYQ